MVRPLACSFEGEMFELKPAEVLTPPPMNYEDRSPRDVKLGLHQFTFIVIINYPRTSPGEHVKCCANSGWVFWQSDQKPVQARLSRKAAILTIADL